MAHQEGVGHEGKQRKQVEQVVSLLRGPRDEERMVGLLLLTKIYAGGAHEMDEFTAIQMFSAVGTDFLIRLLRTSVSSSTPSASSASASSAYRDLALAVLATFFNASPTSVLSHPSIADLACQIATSLEGDESLPESAREDALACLMAIVSSSSSSSSSMNAICTHPSLFASLLQMITNFYAIPVSSSAQNAEIEATRSIQASRYLLQSLSSSSSFCSFNSITNVASIKKCLPTLTASFANRQDTLKFQIAEILISIFSTFTSSSSSSSSDESKQVASIRKHLLSSSIPFSANLRQGLSDILQSRIDETMRSLAFQLADVALRAFGQSWAIEAEEPVLSSAKREKLPASAKIPSANKRGQFVRVLMAVTAIESRLALETLAGRFTASSTPVSSKDETEKAKMLRREEQLRASTKAALSSKKQQQKEQKKDEEEVIEIGEESDSEDEDLLSENGGKGNITFEEVLQKEQKAEERASTVPLERANWAESILPFCFGIVESALDFLSGRSESKDAQDEAEEDDEKKMWRSLPAESVLAHVQDSLASIFDALTQYMTMAAQYQSMRLSGPSGSSGHQPSLDATSDAVSMLAVRLLGLWWSDEANALQPVATQLIPFILSIHDSSASSSMSDEVAKEKDVLLQLLLPALMHWTSETEPRNTLKESGIHKRIASLLTFLASALTSSSRVDQIEDEETPQGMDENIVDRIGSCIGVLLNMVCLDDSGASLADESLARLVPTIEKLRDKFVLSSSASSASSSASSLAVTIRSMSDSLLYVLSTMNALEAFLFKTLAAQQQKTPLLAPSLRGQPLVVTGIFRRILETAMTCIESFSDERLRDAMSEGSMLSLQGLAACTASYPELITVLSDGSSFVFRRLISACFGLRRFLAAGGDIKMEAAQLISAVDELLSNAARQNPEIIAPAITADSETQRKAKASELQKLCAFMRF